MTAPCPACENHATSEAVDTDEFHGNPVDKQQYNGKGDLSFSAGIEKLPWRIMPKIQGDTTRLHNR